MRRHSLISLKIMCAHMWSLKLGPAIEIVLDGAYADVVVLCWTDECFETCEMC